jgi:hypothetical protein
VKRREKEREGKESAHPQIMGSKQAKRTWCWKEKKGRMGGGGGKLNKKLKRK